ncbi:MAG: hypothetical protein IKZ14_07275 [Muribaculaceae bacterium]|nr:hypothetical protein [Muribaculaceae bacterium]
MSRLAALFLTLLLAATATATTLPEQSSVIPEYERDSVVSRMRKLSLQPIEGLWQFAESGATIAIERNTNNLPDNGLMRYHMVIVNSPQLTITPGTIMGYITPTAKNGVYDATIYTDFDGGTILSLPKKFILTLNDESHLAFSRDNSGIRINIWRFLPYMFRYSVTYKNERPRNIDGCIRVFPESVNSFTQPRYL